LRIGVGCRILFYQPYTRVRGTSETRQQHGYKAKVVAMTGFKVGDADSVEYPFFICVYCHNLKSMAWHSFFAVIPLKYTFQLFSSDAKIR